MCTLIVATRVWPDVPLLVAVNRDERLDRSSAPPEIRAVGETRALCPTDLEAGGTWWGLSQKGVFAAVTNRSRTQKDPARRSRGLLVLDALAEATASAAAVRAAAWQPDAHNGFHLVVASKDEADLVYSDGVRVRRYGLEAGIHVITERSLGAGPPGREVAVRQWFERFAGGPPPGDEELGELLGTHADDPLGSMCVHLDDRDYGTRSSTILRLGADGMPTRLLHADGPPCRTPYADLGAKLTELAGVPAA